MYFIEISAQKFTSQQFAVSTSQSALPFNRFAGLFREIVHPGLEYGLSKDFKKLKNYDWFWDVRAGIFHHRFVQTGIPLYSSTGFRYKYLKRWESALALGAGYLHSIPATEKYKLNDVGDYENNKGIGRVQGTFSFEISTGYHLKPKSAQNIKLFVTYQQRFQLPFVKSYVPLLPYNSFFIGISKPIIRHPKK
ncbi:MAG: hypothetical protein K2X48_07565 [Chitinophagaceae bacterium]|nr:hypothetical protein [Chitinophagaceae bacterium]